MSKVKDLPEQTTPVDEDLLYTVDDSEGVNGGKKIKLGTLKAYASEGLEEHLDGGAGKHDASEIDYERDDLSKTDIQGTSDSVDTAIDDLDNNKLSKNGNNTMAADLSIGGNNITNVNLVDGRDVSVDGSVLDGHLDGNANKHDANQVDYERDNLSKTDIQAISNNIESALSDIDDNKLSKNGNNTMAADLSIGGNNITNVNLVDGRDIAIDGSTLDSHLDGGNSKHDASEVDYERDSVLKTDIQLSSNSIDTAVNDLDNKKLSVDGNNSMAADLDMANNNINNVGLMTGQVSYQQNDVVKVDININSDQLEPAVNDLDQNKLSRLGNNAMAADLSIGGNNITNVGLVDGRDVSVDGSTLDEHLDGNTNKHDASEVDYERDDLIKVDIQVISDNLEQTTIDLDERKLSRLGNNAMAADLNIGENDIVNVGLVDGRDVSVDGSTLDNHLNGGSGKHDASEIDYERDDLSKTDIQGTSDDLANAVNDLDNSKLSINGQNSMAADLNMASNNINNAGLIDGIFVYDQNDVLKVDVGINSDDLESATSDLDQNKLSRLGNNTMAADLSIGGNNITNVNLVDGRDISVDGSTLDEHLNGLQSKHDASEIDYERPDINKVDIQDTSDNLENATIDLDNNKLSRVGNNSMAANLDMGTFNIINVGTVDGVDVVSLSNELDSHLDGGDSKHDGTEIDYERNDVLKVDIQPNSDNLELAVSDLDDTKLSRAGNNTMAADLNMGGFNITNVNLVDGIDVGQSVGTVEADLNAHLDGNPNKHDGTEIDYERNDLLKTDVQSLSDNLESALSDIDDNKLSRVGNNTMGVDFNVGGFDIVNVGLVDGRNIAQDGVKIDSIAVLPTDVFVSQLSDFPTPVAGVITLDPDKTYVIGGAVDIGTNRIVFNNRNAIVGKNPQQDRIIYGGTATMFTVVDNDFILTRIGISCSQGTFINATNIDYAVNPAIDGFQGRNKRFAISFCNLIGGIAGNGSNIGEVEGFATVNFNGNLITSWDSGFQVSNGLSFEALNNKSVLWNGQGTVMFTLRDNNWSGQIGAVGSYIPTGINALNFNGNILHPRTADFAIKIEEGHSAKEGNVSGNIFIQTGVTTGGIFEPTSLNYNDLPEYNIQGNQGIQDNTPTIQATIDNFTNTTTTINAANTPVKINFGNTLKTSQNLLFSSRILVSTATGFEENQIITGATSGYTAKIQSIDLANNYLYVEYVIDGLGNNQYFTVGESVSSATANATYNGIDGSFKYYGNKPLSVRLVATLSLEKQQAGSDIYAIIPYVNGVADSASSAFLQLDSGSLAQVTLQDIESIVKDDVVEIYIENQGSDDDVICQSIVWNLSGR